MKYLFLLIVFVVCARSDDVNDTMLTIKEMAKTKLMEDNPFFEIEKANTTVNGFCAGFADIEGEFDKTLDCITNITLGDQTVCQVLQTKVPQCFENVILFLEECLKDTGKQLPRLLLQISTSVTKYFCESTGEQLLELANPCLYAESEFYNRLAEEFSEETKKYGGEDEDTLPSRAEVCKELGETKELLTSHVQAACSGTITKQAALGLVNAVFAPCQAIDGSNNDL